MKEHTAAELEDIRKQAIKDILPALPGMSRANIIELMAAEENEDNPRETLVAALTKQLEKIDADDADAPADAEPSAKAPPAYQAADYTGPLTIDQAQWRLANIKPVRTVATK